MHYNDYVICRLSMQCTRCLGNLPKFAFGTVYGILLSITVALTVTSVPCVQLLYLIRHDVNLQAFIDMVPSTTIALICWNIIIVIIINGKYVEQLFLSVTEDWERQRTAEENNIKERYFLKARKVTIIFTVYASVSMMAIIASSLISPIQDLLSPLNESRIKKLPFAVETFVDQETHFYWILLYIAVAFSVSLSLFVLIGCSGVLAVLYVCAMFHIVGWKLENVLSRAAIVAGKDDGKLEVLIARAMKACVKEHQRTLEIASLLFICTEGGIFLCVFATLLTMSTSLVNVTSMDRISARSVAIAVTTLCYFLVLNYAGQLLIDCSANIFWKAYDSNWYEYPLTVQKSLLTLMIRSQRYYSLYAKGYCEISIATFSTVLRVALSYCVALRQFQ